MSEAFRLTLQKHCKSVGAATANLKSLGFEQRSSGPADVLLGYASNRRTDVDTSSNAPPGKMPEYAVGTLVVLMRESANGKEVFRARVREPIQLTPDKVKVVIDEVVAEMFAKYPTRTRK